LDYKYTNRQRKSGAQPGVLKKSFFLAQQAPFIVVPLLISVFIPDMDNDMRKKWKDPPASHITVLTFLKLSLYLCIDRALLFDGSKVSIHSSNQNKT
jgi:hypothetical protein